MTSIDSLILNLSADLAPVKRRSVMGEALMLAALGATEVALILGLGLMRRDMRHAIEMPWMIWKIAGLAFLAVATCIIAVRSFSPPASPRGGLGLAAALAGLAIAGGVAVVPAADHGQPWLERLAPMHGMLCVASIIVLAMPLMAMLAALMRRAAPAHPKQSALASGLAASTLGALIFTLACPMSDPLYIIVWYSVAIGIVATAARWLLPRRFRL